MTYYKVAFVDLDGTITSNTVNNTFDFIREYYIRTYGKAGRLVYFYLTLAARVFMRIFNISVDSLMINTLFFGRRRKSLDRFSAIWLKTVVRHVNLEVMKLLTDLRNEGYSLVMLTCCTEVPASRISRALKFEECLCRNFRLRGDVIMGLKENRPCYVLKMKHLISYLRTLPKPTEAIYIVDEESYRNEINIVGLFNKIFVIKNGSIVAHVTARNGRALEQML